MSWSAFAVSGGVMVNLFTSVGLDVKKEVWDAIFPGWMINYLCQSHIIHKINQAI